MSIDIPFVPKEVKGTKEVHLKKTLLCVATLSALGMLAGSTMAATESYGHAGGFSLVRHVLDDKGATDRYAALLDVHQINQSTDQTKLHTVVTKATIDEIRKAKGFEQFADPTDMSAWNNIQAVLVRNGGTFSLNNADISVEIANDIKTRNFDAVGINNIGGTLTLTGDRTNIVVKQNAQYDTLGAETPVYDDDIAAVGYLAIDTIATKDASTITNFNAAKTSFDITNTVKDQTAAGIFSAANDTSRPQINVAGDLDITARSATGGMSIGLLNAYSDWNLETDPPIDNPGHIKVNKNLTVDVTGGLNAFGLSSEIGDVIVDGNTYITAKVTDTKPAPQELGDSINNPRPEAGAYGIYVTSNGHVTLNGKETVVTADKALVITKQSTIFDMDVNGQEWVPSTFDTSVNLHSQTTTLNGKVFTEKETKLDVANTVKFNGDADIQGLLTAKSDATLQIAEDKTLTLGESQADKKNTFKNLTIVGGTFNNASVMTVDGELTLNNVLATNGTSYEGEVKTADITANKVVFGNGTKFVNYGGLHAKHYKLETGSLYLEEDKEFTESNGRLAIKATKDILELAGGKLSNIGSDGKTELKEINIEGNQSNDAVVLVSNGQYAFDKVTVNMDKQAEGATLPARLMVTGGTVEVKELVTSKGNASVTDKGILNVEKLVSNGKFEMDVQTADGFKVGTFQSEANGDFTLTGGTMTVGALNLTNGKVTVTAPATLVTTTGQIFANALNSDGSNKVAGDFKHKDKLIFANDSTLTLTDAKYNFEYVASAKNALKTPTLVFSGKLVDANGAVRDEIGVDSVVDGTVHENTNLAATATDKTGSVTIDRNVGGQTLVVDKGNTVAVDEGKKLTLAGTADANGELVDFRDAQGDKKVTAKGKEGGVTVGSTTNNTTGKLSAKVELSSEAKLTAQNGSFTFADVKADSAHVNVASGSLTVEKLTVSGMSSIASAEKAETKVTELTLADKGTTTVTGAVTADKITVAEGKTATLNVGQNDARGDLTVGKDSVLTGLTFFLDPTWVEGKKVTDASRLVIDKTTLDGNVIVGHNSYVVLGGTSDADFVQLFQDGTLTWGNGEGKTLAAAYVAKSVTLNGGSLVVNGALKQAPSQNVAAGTVKFAKNSVLVANVTDLTSGKALITGASFDVDATSKAVIIGKMKNGETYKLTNADNVNFWNTDKTLVAGNKLWDLSVNADGTFTSTLTDAAIIYGDLMQGNALANAGMQSNNSYIDTLLTDVDGKLGNSAVAARFDAAMNVAGAAATFTTAYDRASEFRDAVRGEAIAGEGNRLWAQVTGGKTKLKGISTGAQSLHVDTDAYGLVIGGDMVLNGYTVGAAFTTGKGDSENKTVGVKDDFDFYGLSVYGKTAVGGVDLVADASMTFLKSDLTMGGVADVNTDTDTTVYSMGVQAQKRFNLGVDVTPYVGLDLYHLRADGYSNGHGAQVDDANATALEIPVGATVSKAFDTASGFKLKPVFHFAIVPTVGDRDIDSKVRFAGAQSTYNFTFADDVKVRTGLGLAAEKDNFRFGFNAGYDWGNEERAATKLMLNAQYLF